MSQEKNNNVVNIGHNSNQLTDKLIDTLNLLGDSLDLINQSSRLFERSCKGKMDVFDKRRMDAFEKVEWFQRGEQSQRDGINKALKVKENIKEYLKANGVELEKGTND